jgi:hypothetical protein
LDIEVRKRTALRAALRAALKLARLEKLKCASAQPGRLSGLTSLCEA